MTLPAKLRDDAIVEAVCQARFSVPSAIPGEVVLGRLGDFQDEDFKLSRLPVAEMPPTLRRADPNLRLQPLLELRHRGRPLIIRVGESVISTHVVGARHYPGWSVFKADVSRMLSQLFTKISSPKVENLSLRYINALVPQRHMVADVSQLELQVLVAGSLFTGPFNVNFVESAGQFHSVTTRVAHRTLVQGDLPAGTAAIVDVEVSTPPLTSAISEQQRAVDWFEEAHTIEKVAFFKLLPARVIAHLQESDHA